VLLVVPFKELSVLASLRYLLAAVMVFMGTAHFTHAATFVSIMPSYLPYPLELVWLSGVFEAALGLGLLAERTRVAAAWGLVALYVAVFPANINMALHPDLQIVGKPEWMPNPSALALWLRLPLQLAFIAWAHAYTRKSLAPASTPALQPSR
jgi:uncharacterized membrane protein